MNTFDLYISEQQNFAAGDYVRAMVVGNIDGVLLQIAHHFPTEDLTEDSMPLAISDWVYEKLNIQNSGQDFQLHIQNTSKYATHANLLKVAPEPECPSCHQSPCRCPQYDDDDLGELDETKACRLDNPECEGCQ